MSRYYDPVVGRWLNADAYLTSSSFLGCNAFVYCYNNPIMYVDYTGSVPEWLYILAAGLAVADGPLPFGDLILLGIAAAGAYCALSALPQIEVPERHLTEIIPFPTPPQKDKNDNKKKEPFVPSVPVPQTSPDEDNNRGYTVWFANYNRKTKQIEKGPGISFEKALTYLLAGQNQSFICIDGQTAKMLTNPFSKTRIYEIDKNKEGVEGYYYHYHLDNNHGNPHVWHYGGALLYPY